MMPNKDSVTQWLEQLKTEKPGFAQHQLWERYFEKLLRLVGPKLPKQLRRSFDEEDVALSALQSFFSGVNEDRFPNLSDREDLWKILVVIAVRKAHEHLRHQKRQKRGGGQVRGESALKATQKHDEQSIGLDDFLGQEPDPEFAAQIAEECQILLDALGSDELRSIALLKMQGSTVSEIATELNCTKRTIERRLQIIRKKWDAVLDGSSP